MDGRGMIHARRKTGKPYHRGCVDETGRAFPGLPRPGGSAALPRTCPAGWHGRGAARLVVRADGRGRIQGAANLLLAVCPRRAGILADDERPPGFPGEAGARGPHRGTRAGAGGQERGRDGKICVAPGRRRARGERQDTDAERPRRDAVGALRLHPGGVRDGVRVLPHGEDGFCPPPDGGRDRRPVSRREETPAGRGAFS